MQAKGLEMAIWGGLKTATRGTGTARGTQNSGRGMHLDVICNRGFSSRSTSSRASVHIISGIPVLGRARNGSEEYSIPRPQDFL